MEINKEIKGGRMTFFQNKYVETIANTLLLLLLMMAAVSYNGKLFGDKSEDLFKESDKEVQILAPGRVYLEKLGLPGIKLEKEAIGIWDVKVDGERMKIVNTLAFSEGISGFGGPIPMYMLMDKDNHVRQILIIDNDETPEFLASVIKNGVVDQWIGKDYNDMSGVEPDVVTGATISSNAINRSVINSLAAIENASVGSNWFANFDLKMLAALLVIILGVIMAFIAKGNKRLRTLQLVLNTLILGFWCGKFISISILLGWISNGINMATGGVVFLMLILSLGLPLFFNKKSFYCAWVCPLGSAQELAGKLSKRKLHPGKRLMKVLKHTQSVITLGLFFCLWMGVATDMIDYEPFSAFLFRNASVAVLIIAGLSVVIAVITPRPWCRFACPTGKILNWSNKM